MAFSSGLRQLFLNSGLGKEQPHVTLYLTRFSPDSVAKELPARIKSALPGLVKTCRPDLEMGDATVQGTYGMWAVKDTGCLQFWSDSIVNGNCLTV